MEPRTDENEALAWALDLLRAVAFSQGERRTAELLPEEYRPPVNAEGMPYERTFSGL